jgi:glycosyltransferase involved in cell wall biosynthesis
LKAAEDLPAECRLVIVGDGPLRDSLVAKVQAHEFGSRIDLPGTVTCIKELQRLYANAIAGVSPGYVGLSITQSLGFGVPMIISRNEPHAPEIEAAQDGQNAVFFETDNRDALASTLVDVYRDRERWRDLRESISAQCVRDYSAERMAQGFLEAVKALDDPSA